MTPQSGNVKVQALACPNCGGQIDLHGFTTTLTAVCPHCTTVLDTSTPTIRILSQFREKQRRKPKIPLGSRGSFDGTTYEVIGFQVRGITVEGTTYEWSEYLLYNPYKGFRYLTEYEGHWSFIWPVRHLPRQDNRLGRRYARIGDRSFRHFQHATAQTIFVLGEFPWKVRAGETATTDDYTAPPYVLSAEATGEEVNWSEGRYMDGKSVWTAFGLSGSPPPAHGIYLNQPSPYPRRVASAIKLLLVFMCALVAMVLFFAGSARRDTVLDETRQFQPTRGESSFVTPVFELRGHTSNVEVTTRTSNDNNWTFFGYSLINADTGQTWDFGREVSYYHGYDSDGSWSEGSANDSVVIPSVPSGRYYLRVEPEGDPKSPPVRYEIVVRRDVPSYLFFLIAAMLLVLPVILISWRSYRFEYDRWQESDYAK
jgi:hypothetical protein